MRKNIGDEIVVKLTNQIVQGKIKVGATGIKKFSTDICIEQGYLETIAD